MSGVGLRVRQGVGVLGELLITAGVVVLLFIVWSLYVDDAIDAHAQAGVVSGLEQQFAGVTPTAGATAPAPAPTPTAVPTPTTPPLPTSASYGQVFGIVRIPRFGSDYAKPLYQGTGLDVLAHGVGHYVGTQEPGQLGNMAIAGHRTTHGHPFLDIDTIKPGDAIIIETKAGYYVYRAVRSEVVLPTDINVLAPVPDHPGQPADGHWLTMTSCTPKYSASHRFVLISSFVGFFNRAEGLPSAYRTVSNQGS